MNSKRTDYISYDELFIGLSILTCLRSKDPSTRNGACIINPDTKRVVSLGYNGFPRGCDDDVFPWARSAEKPEDTKYPYVVHAERNAVYNSKADLEGSTLFLFSEKGYHPCADCTQTIIQNGIKKVVLAYYAKSSDKSEAYGAFVPTKRMLEASGVEVEVYPDIVSLMKKLESKIAEMREYIEDQIRE